MIFSFLSNFLLFYNVSSPFKYRVDVISNSIVRERSNLSSKASSKSPLVFSSTSSVSYHKHMEVDNDKPEENIREPIDSSQLSYKNATNKDKSVSGVTDTSLVDGK